MRLGNSFIRFLPLAVGLAVAGVTTKATASTDNNDNNSNNNNKDANTNADDAIINRQLEASVTAHTWPTTSSSPLCEAFAYIDSAPVDKSSSASKKWYQSWKQSYFESLVDDILNASLDSDADMDTGTDADIGNGNGNGFDKAIYAASNFFKGTSAADNNNNTGTSTSARTEHIDLKLMKYALATRAHAPFCEMHRSLAQGALSILPSKEIANRALNHGAFVLIQDTGTEGIVSYAVGVDVNQDGHAHFIPLPASYNNGNGNGNANANAKSVVASPLLDEDPLYHPESESSGPVAVLYGSFHSATFADLYNALIKQSIPFVVRYIGAISNENEYEFSHTGTGTHLQGYGVRLDIRNIEYKSYDDKADVSEESKSKSDNSASISESADDQDGKYEDMDADQLKDAFTNGIDPMILAKKSSLAVNQFLEHYLPHLNMATKSEETSTPNDHIYIPPKSELSNLPVQAAHVISNSKDPLWTLQQLSQNLPSFASALGNVTVPADMNQKIADAERRLGSNQQFAPDDAVASFHVNGRQIKVERPSFNLFELIDIIREENELLKSVDELELNNDAKAVVLEFLAMGKDGFDNLSKDDDKAGGDGSSSMDMGKAAASGPKLRVDVGTGYRGAVMYFNDLEKDEAYANFPKSVEEAMYAMQFRGTLTIRRNVLTVLLVIDPLNVKPALVETLGMIFQLTQNGMPIRVGVLYATEEDIEHCKNHLKAENDDTGNCLSEAENLDIASRDNTSILAGKISTEDIMKIHQQVMKMYGKSIGFPYLYLILNELKSGMTVSDFIEVHSKVLDSMGAPKYEPVNIITDAIRMEHPSDSKIENYSKAVKFASAKNVRPGMAFVNGIPIPTDSPGDSHNVLMEEMQRIVDMMMSGRITDTSPRSIYASLLKGADVRKSMHPLFSEETPLYSTVSAYQNDECIYKMQKNNDVTSPNIMFEAVADLSSSEGLNSILSFLEALSAVANKVETSNPASFSFTITPRNLKSSKTPLASIFRRSNLFEFDDLVMFVRRALNILESSNEIVQADYLHGDDGTHALLEQVYQEDTCIGGESKCIFESYQGEDQAPAILFVNGRIFALTNTIGVEEIEILAELEHGTSKTITERIVPLLHGSQESHVVAKIAAFLGKKFASKAFMSIERSDTLTLYRDFASDNNLYFNWNIDSPGVS